MKITRLLTLVLIVLLLPILALRSYGGQTYEALFDLYHGANPQSKLVQGSDGNFYGTTTDNSQHGSGTVFRVTPTGLLTNLVEFSDGSDGGPLSGLVLGTDGNFYGTTPKGGPNGFGTIFKLTPAGVLTTLVNFEGSNGFGPYAALVQGSDGNFYGTTLLGGSSSYGTAFKVTPAGTLTTLVNFDSNVGGFPQGALIQGSDGNFYGTTSGLVDKSPGTVFKVTPAGVLTTLVKFNGTNGSTPSGGLIQWSDGNFYGTTGQGGANNRGTVFKMTPAGELTTLVNFDEPNGLGPVAELTLGSDGNFYGTTLGGGTNTGGTVFKMTPAGTLTTLVNFDLSTGVIPRAAVVQARDGNFYGTTSGTTADGPKGTVFKMTPAGALTTLVDFTSETDSISGLQVESDGSVYGTTTQGGANRKGTVFKLTPAGTLSTVASFDGTNGSVPTASLLKGSDGNFYGTTQGTDYKGTVFKMTLAGVLTSLATFDANSGYSPSALLEGSDGNFYGTTTDGGANGVGTVFKTTTDGKLSVLTAFDDTTIGSGATGLIEGSDGNFYGTTKNGGSLGYGSVFKITPGGAPTTLASFDRNTLGSNPTGLVEGSDGNFYGTTSEGQQSIFKVTPAGVINTLLNFDRASGVYPSRLVKGSDGNFYGTTSAYGPAGISPNFGSGTAYRVTPAGALSILVDFNATTPINVPSGILHFGSDGKLYGVGLYRAVDTALFRIAFTPGDPTLTSPAPGTVTNSLLTVAFTLPEKAQPGSVKLSFLQGSGSISLTLAGSQETSGAHSFTFDTANPAASPAIVSGSPLDPNPYPYFSLTLSYRDLAGNPGSLPFVPDLVIDRVPPQIESLDDVEAFAADPSGVVVNYSVPHAIDDDVVGPVTLSYSQAPGTVFSPGITVVTVTAEDRAHNQSTISFKVRVHGFVPENSIVLAKGDPAPGRAAAPGMIGVPPQDAVVASLGVPAIDDAGNLAFTAKWTSTTKGKGSGLFTAKGCLGLVGGAVPNFAGSTFKSFGDPVISGGNVACLAKIAGSLNAAVLLAGPVDGPLAVITHAGSEAPGLGTPFKSIKAIEMSGDHLAFLATSGAVSGLWVKDGAGPLTLALLQGQTVGSKKIQKLTSFAPGSNSPGCGRGWLRDLAGQQDTAQVLAFCQFTDKSQAVVAVNSANLANPMVLSQTGPDGVGGPVAGGSFASYGLPALNAASQSTFLASLPLGGVVTKANQRGVYAQLDGSGKYTLLAQTGDSAGATGGNFSVLMDPVLASDGSVAFPAVIKGKTVKGAAMQSLWWLPPGGTLGLLAQGGSDAAELPGAKWKSFTSLAVAPACPIFAATLTPNKSNVTKASANGVWAMDKGGHLLLPLPHQHQN